MIPKFLPMALIGHQKTISYHYGTEEMVKMVVILHLFEFWKLLQQSAIPISLSIISADVNR